MAHKNNIHNKTILYIIKNMPYIQDAPGCFSATITVPVSPLHLLTLVTADCNVTMLQQYGMADTFIYREQIEQSYPCNKSTIYWTTITEKGIYINFFILHCGCQLKRCQTEVYKLPIGKNRPFCCLQNFCTFGTWVPFFLSCRKRISSQTGILPTGVGASTHVVKMPPCCRTTWLYLLTFHGSQKTVRLRFNP